MQDDAIFFAAPFCNIKGNSYAFLDIFITNLHEPQICCVT